MGTRIRELKSESIPIFLKERDNLLFPRNLEFEAYTHSTISLGGVPSNDGKGTGMGKGRVQSSDQSLGSQFSALE